MRRPRITDAVHTSTPVVAIECEASTDRNRQVRIHGEVGTSCGLFGRPAHGVAEEDGEALVVSLPFDPHGVLGPVRADRKSAIPPGDTLGPMGPRDKPWRSRRAPSR